MPISPITKASFIFDIFTYYVPLILTLKTLNRKIVFERTCYQFIINYWLYFFVLQYVEDIVPINPLVFYSSNIFKLWLFYGSSNNLRLSNDVLMVRYINFDAIKRIEVEFINPMINYVYPKFKEFDYQVYLCGKTYSKPLDGYTLNLNLSGLSNIFVEYPKTKGSSGSRRRHLSSSSQKPNKVVNMSNSTSSLNSGSGPTPIVQRSRISSLSNDNNHHHSTERTNPPYPVAPPSYTEIDYTTNKSKRRSSSTYSYPENTILTELRSQSESNDAGRRQQIREALNLDNRNREYFFAPVFFDLEENAR